MNAYGRWVTGRGGAKYFINFETLVKRAIEKNNPTPEEFAGMFGKRPENNAVRENILEEMRYHEYFVRVLLAPKGRTILPDTGKEDIRADDQKSLTISDRNYKRKTVALYKTIPNTEISVLCQRRVYDENGVALQDFDYWHGNDVHVFPHIHVWIEPTFDKRSLPLRYIAEEKNGQQ